MQNKGKFNDAVQWYKKAAYNGNSRAKDKLGVLFNEGKPVQMSRKEIYRLLHEAADDDYEPVFQELYFLYSEDCDCDKARFWHYKFINSSFFKKVQAGMDPDDAITEMIMEQKRKKYIEEVNQEMEEIKNQSIKKNSKK